MANVDNLQIKVSDGTAATTTIITPGKWYQVFFSGYGNCVHQDKEAFLNGRCDALYWYPNEWFYYGDYPAVGVYWNYTGQFALLDRQPLSPNHEYTYIVQGTSAQWTFYFADPLYLNDGHIDVKIIELESDLFNHDAPLPNCPLVYTADPSGTKPVNLRTGEKTEEVTDLRLATTTGDLSFTRFYRQSKQDQYQALGAGWWHNHAGYLEAKVISSQNKLIFWFDHGTQIHFTQVGSTDTYKGDPGSPSQIVKSVIGADIFYTLTNADGSMFVFEEVSGKKRLKTRSWSNGETWTYDYYASGYASGLLASVTDGYQVIAGSNTLENKRRLVFSYINNSGEYDDLQLWRVGDQTASGLDTSTPSGRYVEFSYTESALTSDLPLLTHVKDVRGKTWTYNYESVDSATANYLIDYISPSLKPGDADADKLTLKSLIYTMNGSEVSHIKEELGKKGVGAGNFLQTIDYEFRPDGENVTTETVAEKVTTHRFAGDLYLGTQNPAGQIAKQGLSEDYRPVVQLDANNQATKLQWGQGGNTLESMTDALNYTTTFSYDTANSDPNLRNRLLSVTDAEGIITEYSHGDSNVPRQPTEIKVKQGTTTLKHQMFAYDAKGRLVSESDVDPTDGTTVLRETTHSYYTSGAGNGLLKRITQIGELNDPYTEYTYDSAGRVIIVHNGSNFGDCCETRTEYDAAGDITKITQIKDLSKASDPIESPVTAYEYDALGRRFKVTTNVGTDWEQITLTVYDALSRMTRTISNYNNPETSPGSGLLVYSSPELWAWDDEEECWKDDVGTVISFGAEQNQNVISDTQYNGRGLVRLQRDVLGHTTLYGFNDADRLVKTIQNASQPDYNNDYTGSGADPDLSVYTANSDADQDIITTQVYDVNGNLIGRTDVRGISSFTVYDVLNRPVKTVQNAKAEATASLNPGDVGYNAANDPRSGNYVVSTDPDRDQIVVVEYDAVGRAIATRHLLENRAVLEQWDVTRTVYDELGRQRLTIQHFSPQATWPDQWIWDESQKRWENGSNVAINHKSDPYGFGNEDINFISETLYDIQGRVEATRDVNGRLVRLVYDGLGRAIRTVQNYIERSYSGNVIPPESWVWRTEGSVTGWYLSADIDELVAQVEHVDRNLITETVYDDDGRIALTRNAAGRQSTSGYDVQGRTVISVQNYVAHTPAYDALSYWYWHLTNNAWYDRPSTRPGTPLEIDRGAGFDQNIVSGTSYDERGSVQFTRDTRGNITRYDYDSMGRQVITVKNYVAQYNSASHEVDPAGWHWQNDQWEFLYNATGPVWHAVDFPADNDQNLISQTTYDVVGRIVSTRDTLGHVTRFVYDELGRRVMQVMNYTAESDPAVWLWDEIQKHWEDGSNAINQGTAHDENLISLTVFNKAGQVLYTRDVRGTKTVITYDAAARTVSTTGAVGTGQDTSSYTCYDKAGRVLRRIATYIPQAGVSPDAYNGTFWTFNPFTHGKNNDQNRVTALIYDKANRVIQTIDPMGNYARTVYRKDGQVDQTIDPLGMITLYRYDELGRRVRVVQNYVAQGIDPMAWVFEGGVWKEASGPYANVNHDTSFNQKNDRNIITIVTYNAEGRIISLQDPRGYMIYYAYDAMGRRTSLTNPLDAEWLTAFTEADGTTSTTQTMPGLSTTAGSEYTITRKFDRLGRPVSVEYGAPTVTPDVKFAYSLAGDRVQMAEYGGAGFTSLVRQTDYDYDAAHRLINVDFNATNQSVAYAYDVQGRRTQMTVPTVGSVNYSYDAQGRLIQMVDWEGHATGWVYDLASRPIASRRDSGHRVRYQYDTASRLTRLRHWQKESLKAQFDYTLDARGNRTRAQEWLVSSHTPATKTYAYNDALLEEKGTWTPANPYKTTTLWSSTLKVAILGRAATLTYGVGPDHGRFDVYVNGTLWQSFDGYAASIGDQTALLALTEEGFHTFEIRNTTDKSAESSGNKLRFKTLVVTSQTFAIRDVAYTYNGLSRLVKADAVSGTDEAFEYDLAGNLTKNNGVTRVYNEVNQMAQNGSTNLTYDLNGNLTNDGTNAYTWNRANHLLGMGGLTYTYDGDGNRRSQTVTATSTITNYLLDTQPGLAKVIKETTGSDTTRYLHGLMGLQAQQDASNAWSYAGLDGLGSVRTMWNDSGAVQSAATYSAYGTPDASTEGFAFTGEPRDANGLQYHRARYYSPALSVWVSLDPMETDNRYEYVSGNPVNRVDPSGLFDWDTFTIEQEDTLTCIAAEAGIQQNEFYPFVYLVQDLNNAPYIGSSFLKNPPAFNDYCQTLFIRDDLNPVQRVIKRLQGLLVNGVCVPSLSLVEISPTPIVYPDRICMYKQMILPEKFNNKCVHATGRTNQHTRCCGKPRQVACEAKTPADRQSLTLPPPGGINVVGQSFSGEAGLVTPSLDMLKLVKPTLSQYDISIGFEWYEPVFPPYRQKIGGWFATATRNVAATVGLSLGGGGIHAFFQTWPKPGDYSVSESYSFSLGIGTISISPASDGTFSLYGGFSGSIGISSPIGRGVTASLYLGDGDRNPLNIISLMMENELLDDYLRMLDVVGKAQ